MLFFEKSMITYLELEWTVLPVILHQKMVIGIFLFNFILMHKYSFYNMYFGIDQFKVIIDQFKVKIDFF